MEKGSEQTGTNWKNAQRFWLRRVFILMLQPRILIGRELQSRSINHLKTILKKKRNSNENAKQQHPNRLVRKPPLHRSPKFARSHQPSLENLSDGISADETIPDGKPKPKQTGRRDGVGRALVRRITGMVVTGKSDEERNDNFKTKSFAKDFKLGPLFRKEAKDDDAEVKKDDINLKRRPATLGLPKACS